MPGVQILAWLKAKGRLADAEEQVLKAKRRLINAEDWRRSVLDDEPWVSSLRDQSSTIFYQKRSPEGARVGAALRECREAERALDEADAALNPADRKRLKSIPELSTVRATAKCLAAGTAEIHRILSSDSNP